MPRVRIAIPALAAMTLLLRVPSLARAAHVTSRKPWAAGNEYHVEANVDGRTRPQSEPRAKIDWLKAGQWVTIQCQVNGELAYGSRIWDKVGGYFVPDHFIKTYTDGFLSGSPRCAVAPPENPTKPPRGTTPPPGDDPTNTVATPSPEARTTVAPLTPPSTLGSWRLRPTSTERLRASARHRRRQGPPLPEPRRPHDLHRGQGPGGRAVPLVAEAGPPCERLSLGAVARRTACAGTRRRPRPSPSASLDLHPRARALGGLLRAGS